MSLRVAWIGPYDVMSVAHRMEQDFTTPFHPASWVRNSALALVECKDVELHILMHDKRFVRDYRFTEQGIHFHFLHAPIPWIPRPVALYQLDRWKFIRELRDINPDIVHGRGTENLFSYVALSSGYPHVISIQAIIGLLLRQYRRISRRLFEHIIVQFFERSTLRKADNFIVEAPFAEQYVRRLNPNARFFLLENIVHEAYFAVRRRAGPTTQKILFVGTLINTKGVEDLIRAFRRIASAYPDVVLHLIGTGTVSYVERVIRPMIRGLENRIILRGHLKADAVAYEFSDAAMLVLPSYFDTAPNVVAEAMVAGVPVIGTDVGGIPFMINHDETGQIVPLRDDERLAAAMRRYLDDPALAEKHGTTARERARIRFGKTQHVEALLRIYRTILGTAQS